MARQGLKDVRRSMKKLRPDTLERESLESAIEKLITETMSTSKVSIEFQSFLPSLVFEDDEEDTIYRIVQKVLQMPFVMAMPAGFLLILKK